MSRVLRYGPLAALLLFGCNGNDAPPGDDFGRPTMQVTSLAFKDGDKIPQEYTGDGEDESPPLRWDGAPEGVKSFALICDDPDAPSGTWVHWVLFNIPADVKELKEGGADLPKEAVPGKNDFKKNAYGGPKPPSGKHRYYFKVYALDTTLNLPKGATKADVEKAMKGHVKAWGQLMGTYQR